jgi:hypothetical protein
MRMIFAWAGIGFSVAAAAGGGCRDVEPGDPETSGYLLLGSTARRAGLQLADTTPVGVLPVALPADTPALVLRTAVVDLPGEAEVMTYAFGADGSRDTLVIGADVFADRIAVDGTAQAVQALARELDAAIAPAGDRWVLSADEIWARAAAIEAPAGLTEVFPIDIAADGSAAIRPRYVPPAGDAVDAAIAADVPAPAATLGDLYPGAAAAAERPLPLAPVPTPAAPAPAARRPRHPAPAVPSSPPAPAPSDGAVGDPAAPAAELAAPIPAASALATQLAPARCEDPAAGVWLGRTYRAEFADWYEFTLTIKRDGARLRGTIVSRSWSGEPADPRPSMCWDTDEPAVNVVEMSGVGRYLDGALTFRATALKSARSECGGDSGLAESYALDNFTGEIGTDDVLRAGNSDGVAAFDRRYEFSRVGCAP